MKILCISVLLLVTGLLAQGQTDGARQRVNQSLPLQEPVPSVKPAQGEPQHRTEENKPESERRRAGSSVVRPKEDEKVSPDSVAVRRKAIGE